MHISPDLRKLTVFSCHLNNKEVVTYISDVKKKASCSILSFKYLQAMLSLPATEKGVYTLNTKDATHNITQKS